MAQHSVLLMDEIARALSALGMTAAECDFFAVVVGPGSFTGIRIGIATVKGLALAAEKPTLAVTSFDTLAYDEGSEALLPLVDAGHGAYYACPYDGGSAQSPAYMAEADVLALVGRGYTPVSSQPVGIKTVLKDPARGLLAAVRKKQGEVVPARELEALYLRKSSAEEKR